MKVVAEPVAEPAPVLLVYDTAEAHTPLDAVDQVASSAVLDAVQTDAAFVVCAVATQASQFRCRMPSELAFQVA
jgi:putative NIF3 family GTP cyclohydrolase 1 type 2